MQLFSFNHHQQVCRTLNVPYLYLETLILRVYLYNLVIPLSNLKLAFVTYCIVNWAILLSKKIQGCGQFMDLALHLQLKKFHLV